jgi:hypothetical protein
VNWLPDDTTPLLEAALAYTRNGLRVFPCIGKTPAIASKDGGRGFHDATTDEAQIRAWWKRWPSANIGLPMGQRDWFAFDVEREGIATRERLEAEHGPFPFTLRSATGGGGEHWIFVAPNAGEIVNRSKVAAGCDTRTLGGYIIAPPSIHPDTGVVYSWFVRCTPVAAPEWLLSLLPRKTKQEAPRSRVWVVPSITGGSKRERYARAVLRGLAKEIAECAEGGRNDALNRAWWRIAQFRDVIDKSEAFETLREAALHCGLEEREIETVLR